MKILLLSSVAFASLVLPSESFASCGEVLVSKGLVEIIHHSPRAIVAAKSGDPLNCGDFIVTKKTGAATVEFARGKMVVAPSTRLEIAQVNQDAGTPEVDAVNLVYGSTRVLISKKMHEEHSRFEVRTPSATVGVRGTDFFVIHDLDSHVTKEGTIQGTVEVAASESKEPVLVPAGQQVEVQAPAPGEATSQSLTATPLTPELRRQIRKDSVVAQYDPDFTHKTAQDILGNSDKWNVPDEDELREVAFHQSEFLHQTDKDTFELTPALQAAFLSGNSLAYGSKQSIAGTMLALSVAGEYGINDMFSVGIKLSYSIQSETTKDYLGDSISVAANGLVDPAIFLNGRYNFGRSALHYGGVLTFALGDNKGSVSDNTVNLNQSTGGQNFTPYVAYEGPIGPGVLGGRLSFDLINSSKQINVNVNLPNTSSNTSISGEKKLAAVVFWEQNFSAMTWGVDLGFTHFSAEQSPSGQNGDSMMIPQIETYGAMKISPTCLFTPTVGYGSMGVTGGNITQPISGIYLNFPVRFTF